MTLSVIRYSLSGELQPIPFPNFELGTWNLELGTWNLELKPSDFRPPTADLCPLPSVVRPLSSVALGSLLHPPCFIGSRPLITDRDLTYSRFSLFQPY